MHDTATMRCFCYTALMSWAARRRFIILLILGAVAAAFLAVVLIAALYKAPSCSDGVQNGSEQGIDCGGSCPYLCTALEQAPTVLYTTPLPGISGRTDIIASVVNNNPAAAAKAVPYYVSLYGADHAFVQRVSGTVDLPPHATVPIFVPNIATGNQTVTSAFLTIASSAPAWYALSSDPRIVPSVSNVTLGGTTAAPQITALLTNPSVMTLSDVLVYVIVHDAQGNVIAASQTIVPSIFGQEQAAATFSWNAPFSSTPASLEVVPIIPLP